MSYAIRFLYVSVRPLRTRPWGKPPNSTWAEFGGCVACRAAGGLAGRLLRRVGSNIRSISLGCRVYPLTAPLMLST